MYRRAVPGLPGNRVQLLGTVGESCGADRYDDLIPHRCLSEAPLHQEVHLMCDSGFFFLVFDVVQKPSLLMCNCSILGYTLN